MRALTLAIIGIVSASLPGIAVAQSTAPVVSGNVAPSTGNPQPAPASSPWPRHRFFISIRDHLRDGGLARARSTTATWLGISAAEQAKMTAEDWAEIDKIIDASSGRIHDRRTSTFMALSMATPDEVAQAGPNGRSCPAARGGDAGDNAAGRHHRWIRSLRNDGDSCHWAYRSKN